MGANSSASTTLSSKYQIVIPQSVREQLGLKPGARFSVIPLGDRIELVPIRPLRQLRGFAKGIDTAVKRDRDRV